MEGYKANFEDVLKIFEQKISSCDFVSFDTELTGLRTSNVPVQLFDSPLEQYVSHRKVMKDFEVIQHGMCLWTWKAQEQSWEVCPFNLNITPHQPYGSIIRCFLSQSDSINFLLDHGFDFNKVWREGIPYLSLFEEEELSNKGKTPFSPMKQQQLQQKSPITIQSEKDKKFIDDLGKKIDEWILTGCVEPLKLPPSNSFYRRLTFELLRSSYGEELVANVLNNDAANVGFNKCMSIKKMTAEQKEQVANDQKKKEEDDFRKAIGFRHFTDALAKAKKPLVGHFVFYDLLHTVNQFFEPLPEDANDFKFLAQKLFPIVVDTKHIIENSPIISPLISDSSLQAAHKATLQSSFSPPKIDFPKGFDKYKNSELGHEAGYDAYITGALFLNMVEKIMSESKGANGHDNHDDVMSNGKEEENIVSQFFKGECSQNLVNLLRLGTEVSFNLAGRDVTPQRDNVYYVYDFPKETKTTDLIKHFSPFGKMRVKWIDDKSALLIFEPPYSPVESDIYNVAPFDSFVHRDDDPVTYKVQGTNKKRRVDDAGLDDSAISKSLTSEFPEACTII